MEHLVNGQYSGATADMVAGLRREFLADLAEGRIADDTDPGAVTRRLPAKQQFDASEVQARDSEIMLVMLHGAATRFVQRELQQCGYRVSIVTSVYDALPLVVHGKPDMVVISAIMGELSGIDLALALTSMTETRNTPVALITSFDREHDSLKHLPDNVPVIRKGQKFGDDLTEALSYHFLL